MKKTFTLFTMAFIICVTQVKAQIWDSIVSGIPITAASGNMIPSCFDILPVSGQTVLSCSSGGLHRSTDYGSTWATLPLIPGPNGFTGNGYNGFKKVNDNRILAMGFGGILGNAISKSDDGGATWTASFTGIAPANNGNVTIEDASVAEDGTIYIASRQNTGVYKSTDNGDSWTELATSIASSLWSIFAVDNSTLIVGANNGIYRSTDGGASWTQVLDTDIDYVVTMDRNINGTIYAGLVSGVVRKSSDGGLTWSNSNLTGSSAQVYDITFDSAGNIYTGVFLGGIVKHSIDETPISVFGSAVNGMANSRINAIAIDESGNEPVYYAACISSAAVGGCFYRSGIESTVSVMENEVSTIQAFPNPAANQITIAGVDFNQGIMASIIAMDGRMILREKMTRNQLDIAHLPAGVYRLILEERGMSVSFIKQ